MANTKYYMAETYRHHRTQDWPKKLGLADWPVCTVCHKSIFADDSRKEWACQNPECIMR